MATYGNEVISVGGHKKKNTRTYGAGHAFRSTVQNLPLRTRDVPQEDQITATIAKAAVAAADEHYYVNHCT